MQLARGLALALTAAACPLALTATPAQAVDPPTATTTILLGTTREGRVIVAEQIGPDNAPVRIVVIGQLHGDEPAGPRVVDSLSDRRPPTGATWWLIRTANPDGRQRVLRTNARGVDLNRNFPASWVASRRGSATWSGPQAASEPETRGLMRWLRGIRPNAVVSFHQPFAVVDVSQPGSRAAGQVVAEVLGLPTRALGCGGPCHGTLTQWVSKALDATAVTVELGQRPSRSDIARAARSVSVLSNWLVQQEARAPSLG